MRNRRHDSSFGDHARSTGRVSVMVVVLMLSASAIVEAQATLPDSPIQGFYPIGDYVLDIDGVPAEEAQFHIAEHIPAIMLQTPELPSIVLLLPGSGMVMTVPAVNLSKRPNGTIDLALDSIANQGSLQILASWVVLKVGGRELTLKEKPWLLAQQDMAALQSHNPEYVWRANAYTPNHEVIEQLRKQPADVQVRIFFGSWCPFCKRHVPLMIKVAKELSGSRIQIDYYGLPRGWNRHPVAGPLEIRNVPTAIVYVAGKEVGRISGNQWTSPELALNEILQQQAQAPQP